MCCRSVFVEIFLSNDQNFLQVATSCNDQFDSFCTGISKPRPLFRWTSGDTFEDQEHLKANRTEQYHEAQPLKTRDKKVEYLQTGGERMASIVEFVAEPKHNGRVYRCFAQNPTVSARDDKTGQPSEELNATVTIVVLCK